MYSTIPRLLSAVVVGVLAFSPGRSRAGDADARLQAIYTAEWHWRDEQFPDNEDAQKPIQDHLPKVDPDTQAMRLRTWQDTLRKLDSIPRAELSAAERLNYDVYRPQIEALIESQQFREYEMPANSDTTFWTDLGYTARRPYRNLQDYRNWIAQMKDIPRYFREQMDEMRRGQRRGFTPPKVTLTGRDASITAVTDATPQFRGIHIENLICRGAQRAIVLQGLPEMPIRDITLKNVSITAQNGVSVTDADAVRFENVRVENKTGRALTQIRVKNSSLELTK